VNQPFPPPPSPYGPYGPPRSNGVAIAAMVLGIVGVLAVLTVIFAFVSFIPGVVAIVLGIIGLNRAGKHPDGQGRGPAIAGIVCGVIGTLASIVAFAIVALFVASSDFTILDTETAGPDDVVLSDRTCRVDGGQAVASGILENTSGSPHGFIVTVEFLHDDVPMASASDRLEQDLEDGQTWAWEVTVPVDPQEVDTESLDCRVDRVELGDVVSD
jgi:hypothetical protein